MGTENDKKRVYWIDEEVDTMLEILKEKDVLRKLEGKTRRNNAVYKRISEDLRRKKFHKSSDQIKTKLRFLKKNYFDVKRNNNRSGADQKTCPYFAQLDELYGTQLVTSPVGVDTSNVDEDEGNMFSEVIYLNPTIEFDTESDNDSFLNNDDSSVSMPRQHLPPKKISLTQALAEMTKDCKEAFNRLTEQNEMFLNEQRNLDAEFMMNMQQLMADDRIETERFLERLLNKK